MASSQDTPIEQVRQREFWQQTAERIAAGGNRISCIMCTDFCGLCGHSVYTTSCHDPNKVLVNGEMQDTAAACDHTCEIVELTPGVYEDKMCAWCSSWPQRPEIHSNRSDPRDDFLSPDEVDKRRNNHGLPPLSPADREAQDVRYEQWVIIGFVRHALQLRIEEIQRRNQVPDADRLYFFGPDYDDSALMAPVTDLSIIIGDMTCSICRSDIDFRTQMRDVVQLPCRHAWHRRCLTPWFEGSDTGSCPSCRREYQLAGDETMVDDEGNRLL